MTQSVEDVNFEQKIKMKTKKLNYFEEKISFFKSYFFGIHTDYGITLGKVKYRLLLISHKLRLVFIIQLEQNLKKSTIDRTRQELAEIKSSVNEIMKIVNTTK